MALILLKRRRLELERHLCSVHSSIEEIRIENHHSYTIVKSDNMEAYQCKCKDL